jgi:cell division protein FtsZ
MANRGPALMGTGRAQGDNRAQEAAQEAISSPLLDDISIHGAKAVLINITGSGDLTIAEVNTVSTIIGDACGDEAEIIFGTVHDPTLEKEIRVTVIATGFEAAEREAAPRPVRPNFGARKVVKKEVRLPATERSAVPLEFADPKELEIPTFIRRQMD